MPPSASSTRAELRERLLGVALARLEERGPEALRARELTTAVGTSTQALYTLFGGMPGLIEAVAGEGFTRMAAQIAAEHESDDPVADHFRKGLAYRRWVLDHPRLYRLMFGLDGGALRRHPRLDADLGAALTALPESAAALGVLHRSVQRMADAGRIRTGDVRGAALQFLGATHGVLLLEIAGAVWGGEDGAAPLLDQGEMAVNLMVGLGDTREAAQQSLLDVFGGA